MDNNANELPLGGPSVDLNKVAALNHRRSVTFMNHFLVNTSNFLNNFSAVTEEQLAKQQVEMQKLEIALNILEAKLASIPGLDDVVASNDAAPAAAANPVSAETKKEEPQPASTDDQPPVEEPPPAPAANVVTVRQDPRYAKYLKMLNVGVPKAAFQNKMRMEGLDPSLIDTPDAPVPDAAPLEGSDESDNESQSLSSGDDFSD